MDAVVVGGTGPSGPWLVSGLLERGYEVTVLHRGAHEADPGLWPFMSEVAHIHADPHFADPLREAVAGRRFDLVLATYGRLRVVADVFKDRCDRFIGIGGLPIYRGAFEADQSWPHGMRLIAEEDTPLVDEPGPRVAPPPRPAQKIAETERYVRAMHDDGRFAVTWFRYPSIYGPGNPRPHEWYVVKRVLDGRQRVIIADRGLSVRTRASARNAAHAVLLAVDQPEKAAGRVYNVGDDRQLTFRQWIDVLAAASETDFEIVSLPWELAKPVWALFPRGHDHALLSTARLRQELGYRDAIDPIDALGESVRWFRDHPVPVEDSDRLGFYFDYEAEDEVISDYRASLERLAATSRLRSVEQSHIYAHPKQERLAADERGR
jgi:nucleoside-diphosphate-sugar epimerase